MQTPSEGAPRSRGLSPAVGCAVIALVALLGGAACFGFGGLISRGEIRLPGAGPARSRVWLVREAENQGLAVSRGSLLSGSEDGSQVCVETRVSFLLWRSDGTAIPSRYCECYEREGEEWKSIGECPP